MLGVVRSVSACAFGAWGEVLESWAVSALSCESLSLCPKPSRAAGVGLGDEGADASPRPQIGRGSAVSRRCDLRLLSEGW